MNTNTKLKLITKNQKLLEIFTNLATATLPFPILYTFAKIGAYGPTFYQYQVQYFKVCWPLNVIKFVPVNVVILPAFRFWPMSILPVAETCLCS